MPQLSEWVHSLLHIYPQPDYRVSPPSTYGHPGWWCWWGERQSRSHYSDHHEDQQHASVIRDFLAATGIWEHQNHFLVTVHARQGQHDEKPPYGPEGHRGFFSQLRDIWYVFVDFV